MKKYIIAGLLFTLACSKSNNPTPTPPVTQAVTITVESAAVTDHGGVNMMDVTLMLKNTSTINKASLVIYKTDISGEDYKYPLTVRDGSQSIVCNKYSAASPMNYQIYYEFKSGTNTYSAMMTKSY